MYIIQVVLNKSVRLIQIIGNDEDKLTEAWVKLCYNTWKLEFKRKIQTLVVNSGGTIMFLKTLEKFPENTVLIENMTSFFSEVMKDANFRHKLMTHDFAQKLIVLADTSDYTSVRNGAVNTLCSMLNYGESSWKETKLSFTDTLHTVSFD